MSYRGEVLVAIMNNQHDMALARHEGWYRIPVDNVQKRLKDRWPPRRLAFYQTKKFGVEAYGVHYYADVIGIHERSRPELFPGEPPNRKTGRRYYQLMLSDLQRLEKPILSRRWRYITFIPTTFDKFERAIEINDLYDESPLEDRLWAELKRLQIAAERQFWVAVGEHEYFLDFAVPCTRGGLALETDGDTWHHTPERADQDNLRDNNLKTVGWHLFHFTSRQVNEGMADYCLPLIAENIRRLGGVDEGKDVPRYISPDNAAGLHQTNLFYAPVADSDEEEDGGTLGESNAPDAKPAAPSRQLPLLDIPPDSPPKRRKGKR